MGVYVRTCCSCTCTVDAHICSKPWLTLKSAALISVPKAHLHFHSGGLLGLGCKVSGNFETVEGEKLGLFRGWMTEMEILQYAITPPPPSQLCSYHMMARNVF
ncbi:Hypothetical predicted protein [Podarcis lilfordi]|uniref:Uncharacterized protein n=1 Tax=Podarcis lilfordi TaxID=74358 RepID=A0AA35K7V5_9SAUR|nr:Hypothetical predicted protein [Podarcis lilfordi]